jgi:hypothetical protein
MRTYLVSGLLFLVPLLVGSGLGVVWGTLLLVQCLPLLSEKLADLTYITSIMRSESIGVV